MLHLLQVEQERKNHITRKVNKTMLYIDATDLITKHAQTDSKTIKSNIKYYMNQKFISSRMLSEAVGIKQHTADAYKNLSNKGHPILQNLMKIAEYFGISVYHLLLPVDEFKRDYEYLKMQNETLKQHIG